MSVPPFGSTTWTPWPCPFTCRPRAWPLSGGAVSAWRPWGFYRVLTNTLRRRAEGTHDPEVRLQRLMPHLGSLNRSWNDQPLPITSSHCKLGGALRNSKKGFRMGDPGEVVLGSEEAGSPSLSWPKVPSTSCFNSHTDNHHN